MPAAPGNFVLASTGRCSFCGKACAEVLALVGVDGGAARICSECIGLCWDVLDEEVDRASPEDSDVRPGFAGVSFGDEKFEAHLAHVRRRLADTRESRAAAARIYQDGSFAPPRRAAMAQVRCSFCDAHRMEVLAIVSGPRVFICDGCVRDATAVVTPALRAT